MQQELLIFLLMIGAFMVSCFVLKMPAGVGMMIAAVAGALGGGLGSPIPPV